VSVADRWHTKKPRKDSAGNPVKPCREHRLYQSKQHGQGDRWQVRWRDDRGEQRKANFPKKQGNDPNICADAFDAKVRDQLNTGAYVDPNAGKVTLTSVGKQWRAGLTADPATLMQIDTRLNRHVFADGKIGDKSIGLLAKRPSMVQEWIKSMESDGLSPGTIGGIVGWVSTIFNAAIDDGIVSRNPCEARSVKPPKIPRKKVTPWNLATVNATAGALPDRYSAMVDLGVGCGHRQGELFGIAVEDVDFLGRWVQVRRQVRIIHGQLVFSTPKGGKDRRVPLVEAVALRLAAHIEAYAPVAVTLPWKVPDGEPVTVNLLFTTEGRKAIVRNEFNKLWRKARTSAGVPDTRENGCHVMRHTAASAWLAAGVDIRTVAEYLGHADPGFTLRTYSHLMPDAADRARRAMSVFFQGTDVDPSALDVPSEGAQ
jgi:integrase